MPAVPFFRCRSGKFQPVFFRPDFFQFAGNKMIRREMFTQQAQKNKILIDRLDLSLKYDIISYI